jgi:hypothetical protein
MILLVNYFFMSGTPILAVPNVQNSIRFDEGMTKLQGFQGVKGVKECFANIIVSRLNPNMNSTLI